MDIYVTLPSKTSHIDTFHEILILHTCKEHSFPFKWHQNYANLPTGSKVIDKSVWIVQRVPFWEIWLRKFVWHTTVLQQLQFKMPETVIKHHIWPLKVMFWNRKMPEAHDFDENRKSILLTCRSKIIAFCIATEYQWDWFRAVGSHMWNVCVCPVDSFCYSFIYLFGAVPAPAGFRGISKQVFVPFVSYTWDDCLNIQLFQLHLCSLHLVFRGLFSDQVVFVAGNHWLIFLSVNYRLVRFF